MLFARGSTPAVARSVVHKSHVHSKLYCRCRPIFLAGLLQSWDLVIVYVLVLCRLLIIDFTQKRCAKRIYDIFESVSY